MVRIGWSLDSCSTQLGEEPFSYGYGGSGKKSTTGRFENYGDKFAENDVIGCFVRIKHLHAMQETREDPLEKEMATHSSIVPGESHGQRSLAGYSPQGCRVGHD